MFLKKHQVYIQRCTKYNGILIFCQQRSKKIYWSYNNKTKRLEDKSKNKKNFLKECFLVVYKVNLYK